MSSRYRIGLSVKYTWQLGQANVLLEQIGKSMEW